MIIDDNLLPVGNAFAGPLDLGDGEGVVVE